MIIQKIKKGMLFFFLTTMPFMNAQWIDGGNSITTNDKVGIGIETADSPLHIKSGGQQIRLGSGSNTSGYGFSLGVNNDGINFLNNSNYRGFNFGNNRGELLKIKHLGNVGIGTPSPDAKLSVNGNIHAKEVKVDLVGWPDYVFKKEYNLPTLEEVEMHIKKKGHLLNVPSAKEVEENGIELGEMNKLLLEKIEELTLYTLQQEQELVTQKKEIENLKQLIKNIRP